ncbi:MAG: FUSC family protein [Chlamydiales bacterium]|nr:FUSC family protein [Chlamydiia bacterium]MCP5508067.1 FUSC family protein [Chlamydiales bacterium]
MAGRGSTLLTNIVDNVQFRLAVKGGVAATLSLFLGIGFAQTLDRPDSLVSGLWTVLTAIVVIQAYLGGTYLAAWIRFLGTLVGCLMGGLFTVLFGANAVSLGFSIFCTVIICSAMQLKDSVRIASLSVAVVMVLWGLRPEVSPWAFALFRFLDSCLGILVAVVVMHTLWPTQATRKVRLNIVSALDKLREFFRVAITSDAGHDTRKKLCERYMREIVELIRQSHDFLEQSRIEIRTRSSMEDWTFLIEHLEDIFEIVVEIKDLNKKVLGQLCDTELLDCTMETLATIEEHFKKVSSSLDERRSEELKVELVRSMEALDSELKRYRETRLTKKYPIDELESFFVFYYGLRRLGNELCQLEDRIEALYRS